MTERLDVAYYYPAPYWNMGDSSWVKSLLLFFDRVSILLPDYMYGRHHAADPALSEPLEDMGLLEVIEPSTWIDEDTATKLAEAVRGLLANGVFDALPKQVRFHELSQSRIGYGADVKLAESLTSELRAKGLARPSEDGLSIPLHPTVRTTILVILAQLARSIGDRAGLEFHPTTNHPQALNDLIRTLSRERMPSHGRVVTLDLEPVGFDLEPVPLDELLEFRNEHQAAHRAYIRDLRGFVAELANINSPEDRAVHLSQRRQEISGTAQELQRSTRQALGINLASWSLGIAGSAWSVTTGDPIGAVLAAMGLGSGIASSIMNDPNSVTAYSYIFQVERSFPRR